MRKPNLIAAQAAAYKVLKEIGMPHPGKVDLKDLVMHRGPLVVEEPMSGAEGRLVRKGGKGIIRIRQNIKQEGRGIISEEFQTRIKMNYITHG